MSKKPFIRKAFVSNLNAPLYQPFRTALGQHDSLENLLLTLQLSDGTKGYGEAAVAPHITGETVETTRRNLKKIADKITGKSLMDYLKVAVDTQETFAGNKSAVAAVEMSLLDCLTKHFRMPLWKYFGGKPSRLVTDITIVIADLAETEESVKKYFRQGFRTFKVKIGRDEDLDFQRVLAVKRFARSAQIILDANQGYSAEETLRFLKKLKSAGVTPVLIEQPVVKKDWEGLKKVTRLSKIPVCADESVSTLSDCIRAIREKAVHAINVKVMKFGFFQAQEVALLAKANKIKLMIGGMMESSLAMTASAHLAAGLGCFDFVDLDTPFFIKEGLKDNPYLSRRGVYDLRKVKAGIGIDV